MTTKPSLGIVEWHDAHSPGSTEVVTAEEIHKVHHPLLMTTVGWILADDAVGITIAGEWCGDHEYRNVTFIPRVLVVNVRAVRAPKKKKGTTVAPLPES